MPDTSPTRPILPGRDDLDSVSGHFESPAHHLRVRLADVQVAALLAGSPEDDRSCRTSLHWTEDHPQISHREVVHQTSVAVANGDSQQFSGTGPDDRVGSTSAVHVKSHAADLEHDLSRSVGAARQRHRERRRHDDGCSHEHQHPLSHLTHPINIPVTYMIAKPAARPATTGPRVSESAIPRSPATCRRICTDTCAIAPTPSARKSTDQTGAYVNPPSHAPAIVGAPPINPSCSNAPTGTREPARCSLASGAMIARPSVVLWRVKPTISRLPSVASPRLNAAPMASPSPKLCSPNPIAISRARAQPCPPADRLRPFSHRPTASSPRYAPAAANASSAMPWYEPGSAPAMPVASSAASTSRKSSNPTVRASTKSMPPRPSRETSGNHSRPIVTGSTPT